MAKSIECRCESNLTCGYCLRNRKPWVWTDSNKSFSQLNNEWLEKNKSKDNQKGVQK